MSNKYISKIFNEIYCNSNEYKAYNLGLAVAYSHLYEYVKSSAGQKTAVKIIKDITKSKEPYCEMLNKIIELSNKEAETNAEKLAERMYEHKTTYSNSETAKEIIDKYDDLISEYNKASKNGLATDMAGFEDLTYDLREEYGLLKD